MEVGAAAVTTELLVVHLLAEALVVSEEEDLEVAQAEVVDLADLAVGILAEAELEEAGKTFIYYFFILPFDFWFFRVGLKS
jgi:hypothetical protein